MSDVAVCLGGLLHNLPYTAQSIQKYLLDPLEADLFLYGAIDQAMSGWAPALQHLTSLTEFRVQKEDVSLFLQEGNQTGAGISKAIQLSGNWLGCYDGKGTRAKHVVGSGLCIFWSHLQCLKMIREYESNRGRKYERVLFSRPDMSWVAPHVPLAMLDENLFVLIIIEFGDTI